MTSSTPPESGSRHPDDEYLFGQPSDTERLRDRRRYDELIAVAIALFGLGGVLFWGLTQKTGGFDFGLTANGNATNNNGGLFGLLSNGQTATQPGQKGELAGAIGLQSGTQSPTQGPAATQPNQTTTTPAPAKSSPTSESASMGITSDPAQLPFVPQVKPSPFTDLSKEKDTPAQTEPKPDASSSTTGSPAPAAPAPVAEPPKPKADISFTDVPSEHWAAPFILELGKKGMVEGAGGSFNPEKPVTRAEFAAMLQKAFFDRSTIRDPLSFKDVAADYWGSPGINEAVKLGFMNGYTDGNFQATKPIPKLEGLVAMVTGLKLEAPSNTDLTQKFQDGSQIPKWAVPKIASAVDSGLVVNYPNVDTLEPTKPMTRADAAALIYQALAKDKKVSGAESGYIVKP